MCSESLGSEKVSYGPCAHQESCEGLAAMAKFLVIRFDRSLTFNWGGLQQLLDLTGMILQPASQM